MIFIPPWYKQLRNSNQSSKPLSPSTNEVKINAENSSFSAYPVAVPQISAGSQAKQIPLSQQQGLGPSVLNNFYSPSSAKVNENSSHT